GRVRRGGNANRLAAASRAAVAHRRVQVAVGGVDDGGRLLLPVYKSGNGNRVPREAVQEVGGPVQRVGDKQQRPAFGFRRALLGHDAGVGVTLADHRRQCCFCVAVHLTHEVGRALSFDGDAAKARGGRLDDLRRLRGGGDARREQGATVRGGFAQLWLPRIF